MIATLLVCSVCGKNLNDNKGELLCQCGFSCSKNKAGFYDFRPDEMQPDQENGLKSHMELNFYCNDKFQKFLSKSNLSSLENILDNIKHQSVMDIGCSSGEMFSVFRDCQEYYGFDPSNIEKQSPKTETQNVYLVHNDVEKTFPIVNTSLDCVTLFASYDHLPQPKPVIEDAWSKIKPGGYLLINMTNYGFWLKAFINFVTGKRLFKNEHEHFCVHDPETLIKEIQSFVSDSTVLEIDSDLIYLPNLPKKLSWIYFSTVSIRWMNITTKFLFNKIFRMRNRGSLMTVVFRKKG